MRDRASCNESWRLPAGRFSPPILGENLQHVAKECLLAGESQADAVVEDLLARPWPTERFLRIRYALPRSAASTSPRPSAAT